MLRRTLRGVLLLAMALCIGGSAAASDGVEDCATSSVISDSSGKLIVVAEAAKCQVEGDSSDVSKCSCKTVSCTKECKLEKIENDDGTGSCECKCE